MPANENKSIEAFEKFQKLAQLALSEEDDEPTEEARNAAVKAIEMLEGEDPDLVVLPRAEVEMLKKGIEGARLEKVEGKKQRNKGIAIGIGLSWLLGKGGIFK